MKRRWLIGSLGLLALAGLASFAAWWWAEDRMTHALAAFQARMAAEGWTVTVGATARAGWPLAAELVLDDLSLQANAAALPVPAGYRAGRVTVRLGLRQPGALLVLVEGAQTLRLGTAAPLVFTADTLTVTVPLSLRAPPTQAGLEGRNLRFAGAMQGLTIGLLEAQAERSATRLSDLRVSAEAITLPASMAGPLGPHIASVTAEGSFSGTIPEGAPTAAAAAAGWRDSGGAITLHRIALGWGSLGVSGRATVKLDAALQPDVAAVLRLVGLDETLSALGNAHVIAPAAAQTARIVLTLMSHPLKDGEAPGVELPLALHDGKLSLGVIPLATLGKLVWPDVPFAAMVPR